MGKEQEVKKKKQGQVQFRMVWKGISYPGRQIKAVPFSLVVSLFTSEIVSLLFLDTKLYNLVGKKMPTNLKD